MSILESSDLPRWLDWADHVEEYKSALASFSLELPKGESFDAEPPGDPTTETLYERGSGEVFLMLSWLNKVQTAAVTAHFLQQDAVAQYWVEIAAQFVETDVFIEHNDPDVSVSWFDDVIVRARTGDFSAMAENVGM